MKKLKVLLILAVLVISMAFVYAQGKENKSQEKNQTQGCVQKGKFCCIGSTCMSSALFCIKGTHINTEGCDENCKPIATCEISNNNITFLPYQKRNESECLQGCKCVGAVMSCPTADGKTMTIQAGRSGNIITITIVKNGNESEANTTLEIKTENVTNNKTKLVAKLSNGKGAEIKIMPDTASETAIIKLGIKVCNESNNCTIQLKEVPAGNNKTAAYEVQAERHYKLLALFRVKAENKAQVDATTGEVIIASKPWWAFLAKEED